MRPSMYRFFVTAALCAGLFSGCEWTGSDGESSWSGSYDDMNFSGTYRTGVTASSGAPTDGSVKTISVSEKIGTFTTSNTAYSGKLHGGVVPGSVSISAGDYKYSDDGSGTLKGNVQTAGNGTINYSSGGWILTIGDWIGSPSSGDIIAAYSYTTDVEGGGEVGADDAKTIRSITVSQTGQHLTMIFSNGLTMTGKFTTVNETGGAGGTTYNAAFEVSSSGNKFVGTLDSAGGIRRINGTWISGKARYDVAGTAN